MQKVDIKGGQMTFGQRIELGRILSNPELKEHEKCIECMKCIDPKWKISMLPSTIEYWHQITEGIAYWIKREKRELHYKPTAEEHAAGVEIFSMRVGEMNTIMAIAEKFSVDPDVVLEWKYGKVFNILFTNLQAAQYAKRLEEQRRKAQEKNKRWK